MRAVRLGGAVVIAALAAACGSSSTTPTAPSASAPTDVNTPAPGPAPAPAAVPPGPCTIGFDGLTGNREPFATHTACGLIVTASGAPWQAVTTYGVPAPFIQFIVPGGSTLIGDVTLHAPADAAFAFTSVDLYSSTTKIPYEITGSARGIQAFALQDVVGNTFGRFATVPGPHQTAAVDTLRIRLTNPAAPCCTNPVGLDNIRVVR